MTKKRWISLVLASVFIIILSACGNSDDNESAVENNNTETDDGAEFGETDLTIPYVTWASTTAEVNVVKVVLEELGYNIDLKEVEAGIIYTSIANGSADFSVGAVTLPTTHKDYWEEYEDQVDDIGITMDQGATLGLAVPEYMDIDSIEDLKDNTNDIGDQLDWTIVGIDPGSGLVTVTEDDVMPGYGLDEWELVTSSDAVMISELRRAIENEEPVIVTLWEPHWAFIEWDLKYLEDPKGLFGEGDDLHAIARKGFKEDAPAAHKMLSQFEWTADDMGEVMVYIENGMEPEDAAEKWVKENKDKVDEWIKGIDSE